jgi:hypothetical protein
MHLCHRFSKDILYILLHAAIFRQYNFPWRKFRWYAHVRVCRNYIIYLRKQYHLISLDYCEALSVVLDIFQPHNQIIIQYYCWHWTTMLHSAVSFFTTIWQVFGSWIYNWLRNTRSIHGADKVVQNFSWNTWSEYITWEDNIKMGAV